jgi:hypothetical protein
MKVKYQGVYRDASPFVKHNGVYVPVTPYIKSGGVYVVDGGDVPEITNVLSLSGTNILTLQEPVLIPQGEIVSGWFRIADSSAPRCLWSGVLTPRSYAFVSNGAISCAEALLIKVDGFETNTFPHDGNMHKVEIVFNKDVWLDRFGLSHTGIFSATGQIRRLGYLDKLFNVDDNEQTIVGTDGAILALTGGAWAQYEVSSNVY